MDGVSTKQIKELAVLHRDDKDEISASIFVSLVDELKARMSSEDYSKAVKDIYEKEKVDYSILN